MKEREIADMADVAPRTDGLESPAATVASTVAPGPLGTLMHITAAGSHGPPWMVDGPAPQLERIAAFWVRETLREVAW